ncbi:MAG TPA: hypothetical protein GXZ51_00465 [Acholeplasma sp.]|nr:hypothetical protein [Acholeplasma sp.]
MDFVLGFLAFVFVLGLIILVHEGGHMIFAKKAGILVREFAFGMGPAIFKKKVGETVYSIRIFPIGGFCAIAGEEEEDDFLEKTQYVKLKFKNGTVTDIYLTLNHKDAQDLEQFEVVDYDLYDEHKRGFLFIAVKDGEGNLKKYGVSQTAIVHEGKQSIQIAPYDRTLGAKSLWKRFMVMFGGPLMNFFLAIVVFVILGLGQGFSNYDTNKVNVNDSYLEESGFTSGSHIEKMEISGHSVTIEKYQDIDLFLDYYLDNKITEKIAITYRNNGESKQVFIYPQYAIFNMGIYSNPRSEDVVIGYVATVDDDMSSNSGLLVGDQILKINGEDINNWLDVARFANNYVGGSGTEADYLNFVVLRVSNKVTINKPANTVTILANSSDETIFETEINNEEGKEELTIVPKTLGSANLYLNFTLKDGSIVIKQYEVEIIEKDGELIARQTIRTGVKPYSKSIMDTQYDVERNKIPHSGIILGFTPSRKFSLHKSLIFGINQTANSTTVVLDTLNMLFSDKTVTIKSLSGPVGIYKITSQIASMGFLPLLGLLGMLSVNVGLLNLFPIPALDGGRIVFLGYEAITKKKPNPKVEKILIFVTMILLLALMAFVTLNDIIRLF